MRSTWAACTALAGALLALPSPARAESSDEYTARVYHERAEAGDAEAQRALGAMYAMGRWVKQDPAKARVWWRKAAEQGDLESQVHLAQALSEGTGGAKDPAGAVRWWRAAAEQDHAIAQYNLAVKLRQGEGAAADPVEAMRWLRRAKAGGVDQAEAEITSLRASSAFRNADPDALIALHTPAAEAGDVAAQRALGRLYLQGEEAPRDAAKGRHWLERAAEQGDVDAQATLAFACGEGIGAEKDPACAVRWYEAAAAQGHAEARFNLAVMLRHGEGVPADPVRAVMWLVLAQEESYSARYMLHGLEAELSADELSEGRAQAERWLAEQAPADALP